MNKSDTLSEEQFERLQRIGAYLDDEVEGSENYAAIEAQISESAEELKLLDELRAQKNDLRRLVFIDALRQQVKRKPVSAGRMLQYSFASLLLLSAGAAASWYGTTRYLGSESMRTLAFADESALAYQLFASTEALPTELAPTEVSSLTPVLNQYFGADVSIPPKIGTDFAIQRIQILSDMAGPAIQVTYKNTQGMRIAFRISTAKAGASSTKFSWSVKDGVRVCYWRSAQAKFALTGVLSREDMLSLAKTVTTLKPAMVSPS